MGYNGRIMLKRLAILAAILGGMGGAWSQVPRDGGKQHDKAQDKQETANPPKPVVVVESQHGANNQDQAPQKPSEYPWKELLAPANIPSWFLVIVGAVTGWFVYKTLKAIKKQADIMETGARDARESSDESTRIALATAKAAQKSAEAALLNIQAFINSERPWISAKIEPTPWGKGFNLIAVNKGRTPAMIISHAENCIVRDAMEYAADFLPIPPKYGKPVVESQIVLPGDSIEICEITRKSITKAGYGETDMAKLESGASTAHVFGTIVYRDVLGSPSELTYETQWCIWLVPDSTADGVIACLSEQAGYTGHT